MTESTRHAIASGAAKRAEHEAPVFQLDRDPFLESGIPDPLELRLDALERRRPRPLRMARNEPIPAARPGPRGMPHRPRTTPALSEIELPDQREGWDRLLPERARRALASIAHLVEARVPTTGCGSARSDASALPGSTRATVIFRVDSRGHGIARARSRVLAATTRGVAFDGAMT